jgi:hypothetical protein
MDVDDDGGGYDDPHLDALEEDHDQSPCFITKSYIPNRYNISFLQLQVVVGTCHRRINPDYTHSLTPLQLYNSCAAGVDPLQGRGGDVQAAKKIVKRKTRRWIFFKGFNCKHICKNNSLPPFIFSQHYRF